MDINAAFPGTYLKAVDLKGRKVTVTMDRVAIEDVGGEHKPVLYFAGTDRGLVLNKTNGNLIAELHGPETDHWHGKKITLYSKRVEFQGGMRDGIRVDIENQSRQAETYQAPAHDPEPAPRQQMATPRNQPVNGKHPNAPIQDDEIPF